MDTLPCHIAHWAQVAPSSIAIRATDGPLTFAAWNNRIDRVATALRADGVGPGERVALCLADNLACLTLIMALLRSGAVACPINPAFPAAYRQARLSQLGSHRVIVDTQEAQKPESGELSAARFFQPADEVNSPESSDTLIQRDAPAIIIFTSGSTGAPKAAVLSYGNLSANAALSNQNISFAPGETWLLSLPLHHVAGLGILFRAIQAGATIGIATDPGYLEQDALHSGATHLSLVPRQLARMMGSADGAKALSQAHAILLGGSAIPGDLIDDAVARGLPLFTSYGMTEMATQVSTTSPGADGGLLRTAGRPLHPESLRIGDDGTIEVNGPTRFLGYWNGDTINAPFDEAGWFRTGDQGHIDTQGVLHVTGRVDNMFIVGGENVQPEVIEGILCDIPGVRQAVVLPLPHREFVNTPIAFVDDIRNRTPETLQALLADHLPAYQIPRHILPWPTDLANAGNKISRSAFADEASRMLPSP